MCRMEEQNMLLAIMKFCMFCITFVDWNLGSNSFAKMLEVKGSSS